MARARLHFHPAAAALVSLLLLATAPTAAATSPAHAASACANTTLTPHAGNLELVREAVLCLVNREREAHGESALVVNAKLTRAAQAHSDDMASEDYFSHVSPSGASPLDRLRASGYVYSSQIGYEVGENIAWGTLWLASPQSIVRSWMASPEHRANILDAGYRETGVGVSPHAPASMSEGQAGGLYTQDFGTIFSGGHASRRPSAHRHQGALGRPRTLSAESAIRSAAAARSHRRHRGRHHRRHRHRNHARHPRHRRHRHHHRRRHQRRPRRRAHR